MNLAPLSAALMASMPRRAACTNRDLTLYPSRSVHSPPMMCEPAMVQARNPISLIGL